MSSNSVYPPYYRLLARLLQCLLKTNVWHRKAPNAHSHAAVGSFWYSAGVDGGQRDLTKLIAMKLNVDKVNKIDKEESDVKAPLLASLRRRKINKPAFSKISCWLRLKLRRKN